MCCELTRTGGREGTGGLRSAERGVKETLEEFQGIVLFRGSGLLWKALGEEGFWCPQVGWSQTHM